MYAADERHERKDMPSHQRMPQKIARVRGPSKVGTGKKRVNIVLRWSTLEITLSIADVKYSPMNYRVLIPDNWLSIRPLAESKPAVL
jgi:hypothetical protein